VLDIISLYRKQVDQDYLLCLLVMQMQPDAGVHFYGSLREAECGWLLRLRACKLTSMVFDA